MTDLTDRLRELHALTFMGPVHPIGIPEALEAAIKEIERLEAELAETIASFPLGAVAKETERCAKELEHFRYAEALMLEFLRRDKRASEKHHHCKAILEAAINVIRRKP